MLNVRTLASKLCTTPTRENHVRLSGMHQKNVLLQNKAKSLLVLKWHRRSRQLEQPALSVPKHTIHSNDRCLIICLPSARSLTSANNATQTDVTSDNKVPLSFHSVCSRLFAKHIEHRVLFLWSHHCLITLTIKICLLFLVSDSKRILTSEEKPFGTHALSFVQTTIRGGP